MQVGLPRRVFHSITSRGATPARCIVPEGTDDEIRFPLAVIPCPDRAVGEQDDPPGTFALEQNYPNPFNPTTRIDFSLPSDSCVRLTVYNILGEEIARLVDGVETAGRKSVNFDAGELPTGLYTYRLASGDFTQARRMLLLK